MPDQSSSERFQPEMPRVRDASAEVTRDLAAALRPARLATFAFVSLICLLAAGWLLVPAPAPHSAAGPTPRIDVPPAAADPSALAPHATETDPEIASLSEVAKPWSTKNFFYKDRRTAENVPALLIRLPSSSAGQASSYWALAMTSPYGNCKLEYISDARRLSAEYGFHQAKHPMVGNPCSRTVFDPLKISNLPGSVWARGGIVQGSDLRPPLGIEVQIRGDAILAVRME